MAQLLGIRIQNYRALRDLRLGQVAYGTGEALPRLTLLHWPQRLRQIHPPQGLGR